MVERTSLLEMSQEERNRILLKKREYDWILRRLGSGMDILFCLNQFGCLERRTLKHKMDEIYRMDPDLEFHEAYSRCKGYKLIKSTTRGNKKSRWIDLTELGLFIFNYYLKSLKREVDGKGSKR